MELRSEDVVVTGEWDEATGAIKFFGSIINKTI
jgi:hypothetical protein